MRLIDDTYGKDGVRVVTVTRGEQHTLRDLTLDIRLEGTFETSYSAGDNTLTLPTDTMRGTAYAIARDLPDAEVEVYGEALLRTLLENAPAATAAVLDAAEHPWDRVTIDGAPHPHGFTKAAGGNWLAGVRVVRDGAVVVTGGISGLTVLKSTGSAFSDFPRDPYTTLAETDDRIMASSVNVTWSYGSVPTSYRTVRAAARTAMVAAFATHDESRSVQHTQWAMAAAVFDAVGEIDEISFQMPNLHHIAVDLTPYGRPTDNTVFVATDRPYGNIRGTFAR